MRAIVFGMGYHFGRFMIYKEKYMADLEIDCICDNDVNISNNRIHGIDVISPKLLKKRIQKNHVDVILITVNRGQDIVDQLVEMNIWIKMYVLRPNSLSEFLCGNLPKAESNFNVISAVELVFSLVPPQLARLEVDIVDHCNLNCRACGKLSNIANEKYLDIEVFRHDLKRLKELYSNIKLFRLMGGEPLLHPKVSEFVKAARHYFPNASIRVVTNGLLLTSDKIDKNLFEIMHNCAALFDISMYLPTTKIWFSILEVLRKNNIRYNITEPINIFSRRLTQDRKNYKEAFYKCEIGCTTLREGYITRCERGRLLKKLAEYFGANIDEKVFGTGFYNIHDDEIDGYKLKKMLYDNPFPACSYCESEIMGDLTVLLTDKDARFRWTVNGEPQLQDYFYGGSVEKIE